MSDLDRVIDLVIQGDKENAVYLLASILVKNKDDVEAWLLMGQLIGDPSRKKACYKQVLRLAPSSLYALKKLQELEEPPPIELPSLAAPTTVPTDEQAETKPSIRPLRQSENLIQNPHSPNDTSKSGLELAAYVMGAIAVILVIVYVITSANHFSFDLDNPSGDTKNLFSALLFVSIIAVILILSASDRNRGE